MEATVETITPKDAIKMLKTNTYNRTVTKTRVRQYSRQMKNGEWILTGQGITFDKNGTLQDGQQRLLALVDAGVTLQFLVIRGTEPEAFDRYDVGKNRTGGDVLSVYGVNNATRIAGFIGFYIRFKGGYTSFGNRSTDKYGISKHNILDIYRINPEMWQLIARNTGRLYNKLKLYSTGIMGGFFAYLLDKNHSEQSIINFFNQLYGDDPDSNVSTITLRNVLIKDALGNKNIKPTTRVVYLVKCWNAYITGHEIKRFTHSVNDKFPDII